MAKGMQAALAIFHRNSGVIAQRPWEIRKIPINPNPYDEREGEPRPRPQLHPLASTRASSV
jgi:hypothetical protein